MQSTSPLPAWNKNNQQPRLPGVKGAFIEPPNALNKFYFSSRVVVLWFSKTTYNSTAVANPELCSRALGDPETQGATRGSSKIPSRPGTSLTESRARFAVSYVSKLLLPPTTSTVGTAHDRYSSSYIHHLFRSRLPSFHGTSVRTGGNPRLCELRSQRSVHCQRQLHLLSAHRIIIIIIRKTRPLPTYKNFLYHSFRSRLQSSTGSPHRQCSAALCSTTPNPHPSKTITPAANFHGCPVRPLSSLSHLD